MFRNKSFKRAAEYMAYVAAYDC